MVYFIKNILFLKLQQKGTDMSENLNLELHHAVYDVNEPIILEEEHNLSVGQFICGDLDSSNKFRILYDNNGMNIVLCEDENEFDRYNKIKITCTQSAFAFCAKAIGGKHVTVAFVGNCADPHHFNPIASQIIYLGESEIMVVDGLMDTWTDDIVYLDQKRSSTLQMQQATIINLNTIG